MAALHQYLIVIVSVSQKRRAKESIPPPSKNGNLVSTGEEKDEVLNNILASIFTAYLSPCPSQVDGLHDGVQRDKGLPTVTKDQVCDHLRNVNIHNSMGPVEIHPRVLRELADVTAKALSKESQNHRMLGAGRDLCGSSSPTPLRKQGHLQQAAQGLVQVGLEYLQRQRIHSFSGQPVPVLRHPQSEEVLPHVQRELASLQFVPVAPCPVTGHH